MKNKLWIIGLGILFLTAMMLFSTSAYADHRQCGLGNLERSFGPGHSEGGDGAFFKKAHCFLENSEELGLSEEQVTEIKGLKLETKKMLIKQDAEIKVTDLDIESKMHDYPLDVKALEKLIDQKYELKKAKAKNLVLAYAKLKNIITKEQYEKLHKIWKDRQKEERKED